MDKRQTGTSQKTKSNSQKTSEMQQQKKRDITTLPHIGKTDKNLKV